MNRNLEMQQFEQRRQEIEADFASSGIVPGTRFSHTQLLQLLNDRMKPNEITGQQLLYLVEKGILKPSEELKGTKRTVKVYSFEDAVNGVYALEVQRDRGYTWDKIARLIEGNAVAPQPSPRPSPVNTVTSSTILADDLSRVLALCFSRVLQVVSAVLTGGNVLQNGLLAVAEAQGEAGEEVVVTPLSARGVEAILNDPSFVVVRGNARGEALVHLQAKVRRESLEHLAAFQIDMPTLNTLFPRYRIVLGIAADNPSPHAESARASLNENNLPVNLAFAQTAYLRGLLRFVFNTLVRLERMNTGKESDQIEARFRGRRLTILTNLLLEIAVHERWDYAGVFARDNDKKKFRAEAISADFRERVRDEITLNEQHWMEIVQKTGVEEVINLTADPPRFSYYVVNNDRVKHIAFIPTSETHVENSATPAEAVIVIAKRGSDEFDFDSINLALVRLLGSIMNETIIRDRLNSRVVQEGRMYPRYVEAPQSQDENFVPRLLQHLQNMESRTVDASHGILLIPVRVDLKPKTPLGEQDSTGDGVLQESRKRTARWLRSFLERETSDVHLSAEYFHIGTNGIVVMIYPFKRSFKHRRLRVELQRQIDSLHTKDEWIGLQARVWSMLFSAAQIRSLVEKQIDPDDPLRAAADFIHLQTRNAIDSIVNIRQGDKFMRARNHERALSLYERADEQNGGNPYILRHIAECLIELRDFGSAVPYLEQANEIEPMNPTTYRLWGDALHGAQQYDEARELYRQSIRYLPTDPQTYLNLGRTIVEQVLLHANADPTGTRRSVPREELKAIKTSFSNALHYTGRTIRTERRASYYGYIGHAYQQLGITFHNIEFMLDALRNFQKALRLQPDNVVYEWKKQECQRQVRSFEIGSP
ncbi:MAG: tetratricopeptide repeat protein [Anaerolinea sp.]|nr:tetratricopeptide repeat protein [Anaerolinea sp.]